MSEFKSWRSYHSFAESVTHRARYFWDQEVHNFLDALLAIGESRRRIIRKGHTLWRAQLGEGGPWSITGDENDADMPVAHPPERMRPRPRRGAEGRANPKGIPYLYLSDDRDTAMAEVRPWVGASVSLAQFRVVSALQVVQVATDPESKGRRDWMSSEGPSEPSPAEREAAVWHDIDSAFASADPA